MRPMAKSLKKVTNLPNLIKTYIKLRKPNLLYFRDNSIRYNLYETGIPMVIEIHREIIKDENIIKHYTDSEDLNKIIVINKYLSGYYKKKYKISPEKILVAHSAGEDKNLEEKVSLSNNKGLKVGYVGHLYSGKGMEIISELVKRCKWADFHVVGGTAHDISFWKGQLTEFENVFFLQPYSSFESA